MKHTKPDISIIIVNYRVKEYVALLLNSIDKAIHHLKVEILLVDNNSKDGSVEYLSSLFPEIEIIANSSNVGFGRANNQAIKRSSGRYTLLINPDTVIQEDSLLSMKNYMDENEDCGGAGYRLINADGSFARECKRSIPDLKSAIFRVFGLDSIFPKNKVLGKRFLAWLPEDEVNTVPVISGAAMFWRTDLLKKLNGFDEDFFMYGEDDDLCYRVKKTDYNLSYAPVSTILHFKGESERDTSLSYLKKINEGLLLFFQKHLSERYNQASLKFISISYYIRVFFLFIVLLFKKPKTKNTNVEGYFLIVTNNKSNFLEQVLKEKEYRYSVIRTDNSIVETAQLILDSGKKHKPDFSVVFDINSTSMKMAFSLMDTLKDKNLDFKFLTSDGKRIIGKSSVIEL